MLRQNKEVAPNFAKITAGEVRLEMTNILKIHDNQINSLKDNKSKCEIVKKIKLKNIEKTKQNCRTAYGNAATILHKSQTNV